MLSVPNAEQIILIPQPSDDPNDPLLWPVWKREATFMAIFINAIVFASCPGPLLSSSTFVLSEILHVSLGKVAELGGYQLMVSGILGPIVCALAQKYGKRPQFVGGALIGTIGTAICIIAAHKSNYGVLVAGRVVQGLGATVFESLSMASIGDIYYVHERGWRTALVTLTLACMSSIVSIISGVITHNLGWVRLFDISMPFNICGLLGAVFLIPETQFLRTIPTNEPRTEKENCTAVTEHLSNIEAIPTDGPHHIHSNTLHRDNLSATSKYAQSLKIYSGTYSDKNIFVILLEIFVHLLNPALLYVLLTTAVLVSFFTALAYILSQIWSVPPYNLNVEQCGYFFTGAFVGGLLAISVGPLCDIIARKMARANGGIYEPEFRIIANILAFLTLSIGWFVFMWLLDHPTPTGYYAGAVCHACIIFGVTVTSTTGALYILFVVPLMSFLVQLLACGDVQLTLFKTDSDSFGKYATEMFILQMTTKNLLFFMFSKFINAWEIRVGGSHVMKVLGIASMALLATSIPMYIYGKIIRKLMYRVYTKLGY